MNQLAGKNVVVTGAASGIGKAMIGAVSEKGGKVVGMDINQEQGEQIVTQQGGIFQRCDVSDPESWINSVAMLESSFDGIDHLHLNAGIQSAPPEAPLEEYRFSAMTLARYRKLVGVNIDGVIYGLHYLLPLMNSGGSIVVTGSLAGIVPYDTDPLYSMTKHAVTGIVRSLEKECAELGLRINAICPGGIDTGIIPHDQRTPNAKFMSPEHMAETVLSLFLTEDSGYTWAKVNEEKPAWKILSSDQKKRDG